MASSAIDIILGMRALSKCMLIHLFSFPPKMADNEPNQQSYYRRTLL